MKTTATEADYLKFCRYYKGEKENPFKDDADGTKSYLWDYERVWIEKKLIQDNHDSLERYISEYIVYGPVDLGKFDGIPMTLKALLFNRYAKGSSMADAVEPFKKFYKKYYPEAND